MTRNTTLVLEDGHRFDGASYGAVGERIGEIVFQTGMSGYQETLTDPSYAGQIVVQTAPHIGNTGMNTEDEESGRIWVEGYVVRDPARRSSNFRSMTTSFRTLWWAFRESTLEPSPESSENQARCAPEFSR